jgi:DNA-binding SARP family transcriptional activator
VEFRILGPLEAVDGERSLALGGPQQRALLALLLLHANEVVSSERLLDELWGEEQPGAGRAALRVRVSQLRKTVGADAIVTRPPGYVLRVGPDDVDLARFERLVASAEDVEPSLAAARLREALGLWRGPPLADVAYEPFAQMAIARLEELRLLAFEKRIDADLALGRHEELVPELQELVAAHSLREGTRARLMMALYRSGRQAEALAAYRDARRLLVEELGIEPSAALQELERRILSHDAELAAHTAVPASAVRWMRSLLLAPATDAGLRTLLGLVEPLARRDGRELLLVRVVGREELEGTSRALAELREDLLARGVGSRVAAFTSSQPALDIARLASEHDVDLAVVEGHVDDVRALLGHATCDVAVLPIGRESEHPGPQRPVLVPFTGADDDWAAVELGAWICRAAGARLELAGSARHPDGSDASRLLATASLIVQRAVGIAASPVLVERGSDGLVDAAGRAGLVVLGLPPDWRRRGLGDSRSELVRRAHAPVLVIRKGLRPGGLAPAASLTRYTWTLRG